MRADQHSQTADEHGADDENRVGYVEDRHDPAGKLRRRVRLNHGLDQRVRRDKAKSIETTKRSTRTSASRVR